MCVYIKLLTDHEDRRQHLYQYICNKSYNLIFSVTAVLCKCKFSFSSFYKNRETFVDFLNMHYSYCLFKKMKKKKKKKRNSTATSSNKTILMIV